jgi:hypothetical protein
MGSDLVTSAQSAFIRKFERQFSQAGAIVEAALDAPRLDHKALEVALQTRQPTPEERIAMHALESQRNAPVYLTMAEKLVELKMKLDAGMGDDAPKLVHHMVHMFKPKEYDRVDLKSREKVIDVQATVVDGKPTDETKPAG